MLIDSNISENSYAGYDEQNNEYGRNYVIFMMRCSGMDGHC
jgi:hypothetical protein